MTFIAKYRQYSQLLFCSVLLLLLSFLGTAIYMVNTQEQQKEYIDHYGKVLANSAARQAVDATLQRDLISLQAILKEVEQYPGVIGATVHNVENHLLVQSGFKPNQAIKGKRYSFSAPIALHNNVAGYLSVTIEESRFTARDYSALLLWVAALAIALSIIGWSIQRAWWGQLKEKIPSASSLVNAVVEKMPTIEDIPEPEPEAPKQLAVRLSLDVTNLSRLYQQLNSDAFATLVRRFEGQLQGVLSLYNGQRQMLSNETLLIDFTGDSFHDCCFRAVCTAQLISNLALQSSSPRLQLAAAVHELSAPMSPTKSLLRDFVVQHNNHLKPSKGEVLISERLIEAELLEHLELEPDSGKLIKLKEPYSDLLRKQQEQLSTHAAVKS